MTNDQAIVWDYTSTSSNPSIRTFDVLDSSDNDALLGAIVKLTPSAEVGLVIVTPSSGKVTFWESVENADALSLFDRHRNGIESRISGLYSGERVLRMEDAGYAGFILTLSTGRTVHLSIRDAQLQPVISSRVLKGRGQDSTSTSVFSSIRNVFGSGNWLKDVSSSRSRASRNRGYVDVIIASGSATFQLWQISGSGQAVLQKEVSAKNAIETTVTATLGPNITGQESDVRVIDFEFAAPGDTMVTSDIENQDQDLIVLLALTGASSSNFAIAELEMRGSTTAVTRLLPLRSYAAPLLSSSTWKPRLCLPAPYHTAFAVFEKAVVLVSLATIALSAESQLFMDTDKLPEPYQDTIYLRDDKDVCIIGSSPEQGSGGGKHSKVVMFARGAGVIRVSAVEPSDNQKAVERALITAKSKIEQAVFFGSQPDNPLNLSKVPQIGATLQEVETAALDISNAILTSSSPFVEDIAPSTEAHLAFRANSLENLALHLKHAYPVLSRQARWQLRWDAEKIAAAHSVWKAYDKVKQESPAMIRLLPELIHFLHERHKTNIQTGSGEHDHVRQWFTRDVTNIGIILGWAGKGLTELYRNEVKDTTSFLHVVSDADDLVLNGLGAAFQLRSEKAWLYNLDGEDTKDDVLQTGYEGLPEFWTSSYNLTYRTSSLVDSVRDMTADVYEAGGESVAAQEVIGKIATENSRLIELSCKLFEERIHWCTAQDSEQGRSTAEDLAREYHRRRYSMITKLAKVGMVKKGMALAEKFHEMEALVALVQEESEYLMSTMSEAELDAEQLNDAQDQLQALNDRIQRYFKDFGTAWSEAYFSSLVKSGRYTAILDYSSEWPSEVKRFLEDDAKRAKLGWITDVQNNSDYFSAARSLANIAESKEINIWSKNVELSLAKLVLAAADTKNEVSDSGAMDKQRVCIKRESEQVRIQTRLFEHIKPSLYNAVDKAAEIQLAMEAFGKKNVKGRTSYQQLLERGMESLVSYVAMTPEQLVDVLTLMDPRQSEIAQANIAGEVFQLAFLAVRNSSIAENDKEAYDGLVKIIWRRCFLRDDWASLNNTARKSDDVIAEELEATTLYKTIVQGFKIGKDFFQIT